MSWALARSPGDRSWAWARLASFCEAGLFRPRAEPCGQLAEGLALAQVGQHQQGLPSRVELAPGRPDTSCDGAG